MSFAFTKGKYRARVRTDYERGDGASGIYEYSNEYVFKSTQPEQELYTFRTNQNIQINPVTLEVPGATLDYQRYDCLFYSNGLEVITGRDVDDTADRSKYKYIYISYDNSVENSGYKITYKIDYVREVAFMGIPNIRENYYYSDGDGCDNFNGGNHAPSGGQSCYINLGTYAQYANGKSNISLSQLFSNIPDLYVEGLDNLVQSNVVVTAGMFAMCGYLNESIFNTIRDTWDMSNVLSVDFMFLQDPTWNPLARVSNWMLEKLQNLAMPNLIRAQYALSGTYISGEPPVVFTKGNDIASLASIFSGSAIYMVSFDPAKISLAAHCRNSAYWDSDDDGYAYMCASCGLLTYVTTPSAVLSGSEIVSSYPLTFKGMFSDCVSLSSILMPEIRSTSSDSYGAAINMKNFVNGCASLSTIQIGYSANNDSPIKLSARRINFQGAFYGCQRLQKLNFIIATANTICDFNENSFVDCGSLTELNLNNMEARGYLFLDDCTSLTTLKCPQSIYASSRLPYTMYDSNGNSYSTIPGNNVTLYSVNPAA